jgi:hypothetical protein
MQKFTRFLAGFFIKSNHNVAIVLLALSASIGLKLDGQFAEYCKEFAKKVLYDIEVGNIPLEYETDDVEHAKNLIAMSKYGVTYNK